MSHRWPVIAVALLVSLAGLVGCGGNDSSTATPEAPVTVTETVTATPTETSTLPPPTVDPTPAESTAFPTLPTEEPPPTAGPVVDVRQPPRTYDAALAHFDAVGSEPVDFSRFETPSGNIYCVLDDDVIPPSCELGTGTIKDTGYCDPDGPSTFVGRIEFDHGRATPICNTDTIRTPGPPILGYTAAARFAGGDIQCLSEKIGVTCINLRLTEGFFLRKGQFIIFNAG